MVLPPFEPGAVKVTVAWAFPAVAVPIVGAPGTVAGVTLAVLDAAPEPTALRAVTLQLTAAPLVRPVTVMGDAAAVAVCAPQVAV